jgi:hypothetical protein
VIIAKLLEDLKQQSSPADELVIPNDQSAVPEIPLHQAAPVEPAPASVAPTGPPPVLSAADLFSIAAMRGWEALPYRPGERAGGSQRAWRVFTEWVHGTRLAEAARAAWLHWPATVENYMEIMEDPRAAVLIASRRGVDE